MDYFDFCHFSLNPSVKSSVVSAEGYDVTNLISSDLNKKQKGFMVYRTINPPVDVTFTFMCKVNISHICIWPQVGNQKSSGFQISTYTGKQDTIKPSQFVNIASGFLRDEPGVVFHHTYEPSNASISNFLRRRLSYRKSCLTAVRTLQVKIFKTSQSSVPAILRVEVWGLPSVSCPKEIRMKVLDLWAKKDKKSDTKVSEKGSHQSEKKSDESVLRSTAVALTSCNFEIPDDFLDPITCEIMVLPYILPSGKIIDHTTLEKHENHEANWGRRPSDPFTGKFFSDTSKPVPASSLKARIDKFLIENANVEELKKVPRTVGRQLTVGSSSSKNTVVDLTNEVETEHGTKVNDTKSDSPSCEGISGHRSSVSKRKAKYEILEVDSKRIKISKECTSSLGADFSINCSGVSLISVPNISKQSHENLLNDSLDAALKSALAGLPSFTKFTSKVEDEKKCLQCNEKEILYILPCQHFLCRDCLTKIVNDKDCKCYCCNSPFKSADPKRYFA